MTKPKAQTIQQKLGFFDDDLKKPKHDELMLWLDSNIEKIVNKLFNQPFTEKELEHIKDRERVKTRTIIKEYESSIASWEKELGLSISEKRDRPSAIQRSDEELQKYISEIKRKKLILEQFDFSSQISAKPRITRIDKKWELPITTASNNNKSTIGFIDFCASFSLPHLSLSGLKFHQKEFSHEEKYYDIDENALMFKYIPIGKSILVEVKTEIISLGELIRQVNQYKTYFHGDYYVLCPNNKYKDILMEQGIKSIDYE
ncbi:MAG: hypothetical protein WCI92_06875 [Bacteroidota bacterium]